MAVALYTAVQSTSLSNQCRCHQLAPRLFQIQSHLLIETFWGSCCPPLSVHTHGNPIHRVLVLFHVIRQLCSLQCSCHLNFVPLHGWSSATVPRFARSSLRLLINTLMVRIWIDILRITLRQSPNIFSDKICFSTIFINFNQRVNNVFYRHNSFHFGWRVPANF